MEQFIPALVFIHVAAAFLFAAAHGVSLYVAFQLRREAEPSRMKALLDLSAHSLKMAGVGLLVLLLSGIAAGILLGSFGRIWIWLALVLLIVVGGLMTPVGAFYHNRIRQALGIRTDRMKADEPDPIPVSADELSAMLDNRRPEMLLLLGGGGFLVILWLMMYRPF